MHSVVHAEDMAGTQVKGVFLLSSLDAPNTLLLSGEYLVRLLMARDLFHRPRTSGLLASELFDMVVGEVLGVAFFDGFKNEGGDEFGFVAGGIVRAFHPQV